jgi:hypothetical protein
MLPTYETNNFSHTAHSNGIHEFIFKTAGREACDELITRLDSLYGSTPMGETLLELFDIRVGIGSVSYAMKRAAELVRKHPNPPRIRGAMLYRDGIVVSLLAPSVRLLRAANFEIRFFKPDQRAEAIDWLLSQR